MGRGRPPKSKIRQNMIELLHVIGSEYGYKISKLYREIFPAATRRVIYYHLRKGVELEEFSIDRIEREEGDFSWGPVAEKTYYKLGKNAEPAGLEHVRLAVTKIATK